MSASNNLHVFREIFKECSIFAKKIYTILNDHEEQVNKGKRKAASSNSGPDDASVDGGSQQGGKKKRKKREGPKRPLSSYMLFVREERPGIVAKHPDAKFTEIGKILGNQWAKLSDDEKKKYEDMALEDKARYNHELTVFQTNNPDELVEVPDDVELPDSHALMGGQVSQGGHATSAGDMKMDDDSSGNDDNDDDDDEDIMGDPGKKNKKKDKKKKK